jgi:transposase
LTADFSARNRSLFLDHLSGMSAQDLAGKYGIGRSRAYAIISRESVRAGHELETYATEEQGAIRSKELQAVYESMKRRHIELGAQIDMLRPIFEGDGR